MAPLLIDMQSTICHTAEVGKLCVCVCVRVYVCVFVYMCVCVGVCVCLHL